MQQLGRTRWRLVFACGLAVMSSVACSRARPDEPSAASAPAQPATVTNYGYKVIQDRKSVV